MFVEGFNGCPGNIVLGGIRFIYPGEIVVIIAPEVVSFHSVMMNNGGAFILGSLNTIGCSRVHSLENNIWS